MCWSRRLAASSGGRCSTSGGSGALRGRALPETDGRGELQKVLESPLAPGACLLAQGQPAGEVLAPGALGAGEIRV